MRWKRREKVTKGVVQIRDALPLLNCAGAKTEKGKEMETIISACISAAVTLIVCVISNNAQQEKTRTLMEYKLEELTKRVNEHNNLIKRTYALEEKMSVHEEQIKVANHRIEDLERKGEGLWNRLSTM